MSDLTDFGFAVDEPEPSPAPRRRTRVDVEHDPCADCTERKPSVRERRPSFAQLCSECWQQREDL